MLLLLFDWGRGYGPQRMRHGRAFLVLATLTGAVVVGLGHELSGIYPSTDNLRDQLVAAIGKVCGDGTVMVWCSDGTVMMQ